MLRAAETLERRRQALTFARQLAARLERHVVEAEADWVNGLLKLAPMTEAELDDFEAKVRQVV